MNLNVEIRLARLEDRKEIESMWEELHREQHTIDSRFELADDALNRWRNDFPHWIGSRARRLFVAEQAGCLAGFLSAERHYTPPIYRPVIEVFFTEMYVMPKLRRQGIGRQIASRAVDWAREIGAQRIRMVALSANEVSLAFWTSAGGRPFTETLLLDTGVPYSETPGGEKETSLGF